MKTLIFSILFVVAAFVGSAQTTAPTPAKQCIGVTSKKVQCKRQTTAPTGLCWQHGEAAAGVHLCGRPTTKKQPCKMRVPEAGAACRYHAN